jgi:hypothetical protein
MTKNKTIVCVSASFEKKEELFSTLKKYGQSADDHFTFLDEFAFTTDILPECDALVIFNTPGENIQTLCYPENVIAFMMEPGLRREHPWMFKGLKQYQKVYSPIQQSAHTIQSHGFLGWYFKQDYTYLKNLTLPEKTKAISCIASNLKQLEGHRLRLNFIKILQQRFSQMDFFGKGSNFLEDKMNGLLPYRYSIAIENTSQPDYFTEKINDCFLTYTVPFYYGCRNIGRYFPERSYIQIDIANPELAIRKIESVLTNDDWEKRLDAVKEARQLVLNKYQPLAGAADALRQIKISSEKKMIILKPVKTDLLKRIRTALNNLVKN